MELKNISSDFNSVLKSAATDKKIDQKELDQLKGKASTADDKKVIEMLTKDQKKVDFSVKEGSSVANYSLSLDLADNIPSPEPEITGNEPKFRPNPTSYSTLGEGDKTKAVDSEPNAAPAQIPVGSLDEIAAQYNTPEKISALMGSVNYDKERGKPLGGSGPLGAQKPEDTLSSYSGVCRDIHQLGAYLLTENGYEAKQVGYVGARTSHSITVYKPPGGQGYGIIEYGKVYSPEKVKELLGRYATSAEEAVNALNFGTATSIYLWTPPKEGEVGYVEGIFYTQKHENYHKTLQLEHKDRMVIDRQLGVEVEKTLGKNFSVKAGVNFDSPGDPTARYAPHLSLGFRTGNEDNWFKAGLGAQYRPFDGGRVVGSLDWQENPTFLMGADLRWQLRPLKAEYLPGQFTSTTFTGNLSGAFLALNKERDSDSGEIKATNDTGYDLDYISGLPDGKLGLDQRFYGRLGEHFSYNVGAFANYDVNLAIAGMSMGAPNPFLFFNTGVNGKMTFEAGKFYSSVGAQYMFTQVNNRDNTSVGLETGYGDDKFKVFSSANYIDSVEGGRIQLREGVRWQPIDQLALTGEGRQELVIAEDKVFSNPGSNSVMFGLEGRF